MNNMRLRLAKMALLLPLLGLLAGCVMPDGTVVTTWPPVLPSQEVAVAQHSSADSWIEQGMRLGEEGDLVKALAAFDKAVTADPATAAAYYYRAITYYQMGDPTAALADADQYVALAPDVLDGYGLRADVRSALGDYQGAVEDLTQALTLLAAEPTETGDSPQPLRAQLYDSRRLANYRLKEPEAELADLEAYLALNPWDTAMFTYLHERRQSVAAYRATLAQHEQSMPPAAGDAMTDYDGGLALLLRGHYLGYPDDVAAAADAFTAAIAADPTLAAAYHMRGLAYLAALQVPEYGVTGMQMEGETGTVTRVDPATNETFTQTIESYQQEINASAVEQSQAAAKAIEDFQHALVLDPTMAEAVHDLGVVYYAYGLGEPAPIEDAMGVAGALFGTSTPDEATLRGKAAALPLLNQAADLAPDWPLARQSRALANLFFGVERASGSMQAIHATLNDVAYSPTGDRIASASSDGKVRIWDAEKGTLLLTIEQGEAEEGQTEYDIADSVAFSPDGQWLATTDEDHLVRIRDAESGQELLVLSGHEETVTDVAFSPDGARLASASYDGSVRIWDTQSGEQVSLLAGSGPLAFSPDGLYLASGTQSSSVQIWDAANGAAVTSPQSVVDGAESVAYSPDGATLAMLSNTGEIELWDVATGKKRASWSESYDGWTARALAYSPDGLQIATVGGQTGVRLWDAQTGQKIKLLEGHDDVFVSIAYSPDGKSIASGDDNGILVVWNVATTAPALQLSTPVDQNEVVAEAMAALKTAQQDATYLIAQGTEDGWPYYIRILAMAATAELTGEEADSAQIEADYMQFLVRSPNANYDFLAQEAESQLRLSISAPPLLPFLSGGLEPADDKMFYINDGLGMRMELPNQAPNHTLADVSVPGAYYLRIHDDFRIIDLVVVDAALGERSLEEWLAAVFVPLYPDATVLPEPLETTHGSAILVDIGSTRLAFLPVGEQIYTFAYQPGVEASSGFADDYDIRVRPANAVLSEMTKSVTFAQE